MIEHVQTLALPASALAASAPAHVRSKVDEIAAAQAAMPDVDDEVDDLWLRRLIVEPGDELAERISKCEQRGWAAQRRLREVLAEAYLGGVSPVVRRAFVDAMASTGHDRRALAPAEFHERFRTHAAALTAGADIRALAAARPPRAASTDIYTR